MAETNIRAGGRPGRTDPRGNSESRRRRKEKMLNDSQFKHTESHSAPNVHCVHCDTMLTYDTVEADRKKPGGPYAYHNVQPSCRNCNAARSNNPAWKGPSAAQ